MTGLWERLRRTEVGGAILRHGPPDSPLDRSLLVTSNVFLHVHPVSVRPRALRFGYTWYAGFAALFLFAALVLTGVLLMFYYTPSTDLAYRDMQDLAYAVPYGRLLRNMHRWAAHGMVVLVILHMLRVFLAGAYRPPRQFNWCVGVGLLFLTLLLSFTGYLLPWDQLAYWAVTVGTRMAANTPFLGHKGPFHELLGMTADNDLAYLLLGGTRVGQAALLRFYVLHCVVLPLAVTPLVAVHLWRVRKDGGFALGEDGKRGD